MSCHCEYLYDCLIPSCRTIYTPIHLYQATHSPSPQSITTVPLYAPHSIRLARFSSRFHAHLGCSATHLRLWYCDLAFFSSYRKLHCIGAYLLPHGPSSLLSFGIPLHPPSSARTNRFRTPPSLHPCSTPATLKQRLLLSLLCLHPSSTISPLLCPHRYSCTIISSLHLSVAL